MKLVGDEIGGVEVFMKRFKVGWFIHPPSTFTHLHSLAPHPVPILFPVHPHVHLSPIVSMLLVQPLCQVLALCTEAKICDRWTILRRYID